MQKRSDSIYPLHSLEPKMVTERNPLGGMEMLTNWDESHSLTAKPHMVPHRRKRHETLPGLQRLHDRYGLSSEKLGGGGSCAKLLPDLLPTLGSQTRQ